MRKLATLGALVLILGEWGVTMMKNVPMNDALAKHQDYANMTEAHAEHVWTTYSQPWTSWNTVRAVSSIVSTAAFAMALRG